MTTIARLRRERDQLNATLDATTPAAPDYWRNHDRLTQVNELINHEYLEIAQARKRERKAL